MRRIALTLLALALPLAFGACKSSIFHAKPQPPEVVVHETCTPLDFYGNPIPQR